MIYAKDRLGRMFFGAIKYILRSLLWMIVGACSVSPEWKVCDITPELLNNMQRKGKKLVLYMSCNDGDSILISSYFDCHPQVSEEISQQAYWCYMNTQRSLREKAINASLLQTVSPKIYVFDEKGQLFSCVAGYTALGKLAKILRISDLSGMDDCLKFAGKVAEQTASFRLLSEGQIRDIVTNSFWGYVYLEEKPLVAKEYFQKSLLIGEFFYNNYLMYKCTDRLRDTLNRRIYRERASLHQSSVEWLFFEDAMLELGLIMPEQMVEIKKRNAERRKKTLEAAGL